MLFTPLILELPPILQQEVTAIDAPHLALFMFTHKIHGPSSCFTHYSLEHWP